MPANLYVGLPREFSPPWRAAEAIADLNTARERWVLFQRIPSGWGRMIAHFAKIAIAARIIELAERDARVAALEEVPLEWREDVRGHGTRLWQTRQIRAQYALEQAAKASPRRGAV